MAARADSALSKVLLDTGGVEPAALEEAVQQQVIHGGALDTILLEMGVCEERRLAELLSEAHKTEAVALERIEHPDADAVRALPERMAVAMRLCPVFLDDAGLHVLSASPADRGLVDELAVVLGRKIVAHVVPEVRLHQALGAAYGAPTDERFMALLSELRVPVKERPRDVGDDVGAAQDWDLVEALAHLAAVDTRDGISRVACAYARKYLPFAAMIGVRGGQAVGWYRSGPAEGVQFTSRPFSIPDDSVLFHALQSPSPSLGKPALAPGNSALFGWLGRRRPRTVLVVPVTIAGRVIAALIADGGIRARDFSQLADLVAFGARLGPAFEKAVRNKKEGASTPPTEVATASDAEVAGASTTVAERALAPAPPPPPPPLPPPPLPADAAAAAPSMPVVDDVPAVLKPPARDLHEETTARVPTLATPRARGEPTHDETTGEGDAASSGDDHGDMMADALRGAPRTLPDGEPVDDAQGPPTDEAPATNSVPRPITMTGMPAFSPAVLDVARRADGTSPFARNYVPPRAAPAEAPSHEPPPAPPPVLESLASAGIEEALRSAPPAQQAEVFAEVTDAHAADAWRGALQETVARGHQGGSGAHDEQARLFLDEDGWEEVVYEVPRATGAEPLAPLAPLAPLGVPLVSTPRTDDLVEEALARVVPDEEREAVETLDADPPSPVEMLVDSLEALDAPTVEYALRQLLRVGSVAIPALAARFPGRLRVDPFDPGENVRRAEDLGPLVSLLEKLGANGLEAAIPHLDSRYPAHRFAAVLLFALNPDPRGIDLLRARLHDTEPRVRGLAAEALVPFIAHPRFDAVLNHLRERLASPLLDARRRAVQLLGAFRDVGSVPHLMALLESRDRAELAEDLRAALRAITLQDFGVRGRGWQRWWERARKRSRVDWLIDGLASEDRELRTVAAMELTALAGDDFGYRADGDKRSRQRTAESFARWWLQEQRSYGGGGPATSSPTASTGSRKSPD